MGKRSLLDISVEISTEVHSVFSFNPKRNDIFSTAAELGHPKNNLAIPEQIHSTHVQWIDVPGEYADADCLVTQSPDIVLTLKAADCVPVYFLEPQEKIIGLAHSGWRGTVGGIVIKTIDLMQKNGADIRKILVYLGPAIGICCYEVKDEVAKHFDNRAKKKLYRDKWKVGLNQQIKMQLVELGIKNSNIRLSKICTFESDECHSYRRDGEKSSRMFAFMGLK